MALSTAMTQTPTDDARKRAIAYSVWTDLLRMMPPHHTFTVTVRDGRVAVELGPPLLPSIAQAQ